MAADEGGQGDTRAEAVSVEQIAAEAARWLAELENADEKTRAAFVSWLTTSPRHVEEFLRLVDLSAALARLRR